jgi:small subunit ribosomal protein S16
MSVRVRLTRVGSRKNPIWRVVVADQRSPRDGRFIEMIGHYNPQTDPSTIAIDEERLQHWLVRGAQPTSTVKQLMKAQAKGGGAKAVAEQAAAVPQPQPDEAEGAHGGTEAPGSGQSEASESASTGVSEPAQASEPAKASESEPAEAPEPGS